MVNLSKLFAEQEASQIDWNGPLYSLYEISNHTDRLAVHFLSRASELRQGIRLKARGGQLLVNGSLMSDVVLREDSAPNPVHVEVRWTGKATRSLRVWNCWDVNGVMHAWLGNAAMRVEQASHGETILRCSDGHGEPDFRDLVVRISTE